MKDAPGQGTQQGLAAGIYWGVILMLSVLGAMIVSVVFLMVRAGRRRPIPSEGAARIEGPPVPAATR